MKLTISILFIALLINIIAIGQTGKKQDKGRFVNYKEIEKFPRPEGCINDFEHIFTIDQKQELDSIITHFSNVTTNQIAIVSVKKYKPYESIKDLTTDLGNYWGVSSADKDNGLIITISKNKRSIWIGTGLGTEKVLTNEIVSNVIDNIMIPYFKKDNYFEGIKFGLLELMELWK